MRRNYLKTYLTSLNLSVRLVFSPLFDIRGNLGNVKEMLFSSFLPYINWRNPTILVYLFVGPITLRKKCHNNDFLGPVFLRIRTESQFLSLHGKYGSEKARILACFTQCHVLPIFHRRSRQMFCSIKSVFKILWNIYDGVFSGNN